VAEIGEMKALDWLGRLGPALINRQPTIAYWRRYYDGDHDLPSGPEQHHEAFRRFQRLSRTNLCLLCAESMVHRMQVTGYRTGDPDRAETPNPVWALWQRAKLDARQYGVYRKAFARSAAYVTVGPDPRNNKRPRVTIEGPENVIVETDPADHSVRLAGLRFWYDSIVKRWMATLYVPGWRYHWQTKQEYKTKDLNRKRLKWTDEFWEYREEPARSYDPIPVVPFLNGDEDEDPKAEFDIGIDVQNRLNLSVLNRLSSERYAAYRQRFMTNYEADIDKVTGLPISPFRAGVDQIWTTPPPDPGMPETKLGDFAQTDTSQMLRGCEADMRAFAAVTLTPVYYLPGDLVNIGADSVSALDAGHVAKVRQRMANFGEAWEEVLAVMAQVAELSGDMSEGEVTWARPENFNPAQYADYMSKLVSAKVPLPMVAEQVGWSPQLVSQLRAELASAAFLAAATAPAAIGPGPAVPEPPPPNGAVTGA
jgi:hypothetical protein